MRIEHATQADAAEWATMRHSLWSNHSIEEHAVEVEAILATPPDGALVLIARDPNGRAIGFAEASLRHDYVNGCESSPVGFLEGIYVDQAFRRQGVARALTNSVIAWARRRGCSEVASDASIENTGSHRMHTALGFDETQRVVYFRKRLT